MGRHKREIIATAMKQKYAAYISKHSNGLFPQHCWQ